jgi:alanine racemase
VRFYSAAEALSGRAFRLHHCCNSGGTLAYPDFHLDMARAGLVLYGYNPFERVIDDVRIYSLPNHQLPPREAITGVSLIPAMSLKTRVAQIKRCRAGERISYGGKFTFTRDSAVAVLPIGYADGLSRSLSGKFSFRAGEKFIPQIGRICMDICMADITDAPEIRAGDAVTLFGPRPALSARDLADYCGTIPYELLCAVSSRIPRVYIG